MKPFIVVVTDKKINGLKRFSTIFCIYISLIGLAERLNNFNKREHYIENLMTTEQIQNISLTKIIKQL